MSSSVVMKDIGKRHTISASTRTQEKTNKSRLKVRRSSFSSTLDHRVHLIPLDEMSTGKSETALFPAPNRIPSSLQTSPVIPDKRFANVSRLPRLKNDSPATKKVSRDESNSSILSRINRDRLERWSESLHDLLTDSVGIRLFEEFLVKECSQENLAFWKACKRYSDPSLTPDDRIQEVAESIYTEFISHQAPNLVNIDHTVRTKIMSSMTNGVTRTTFDPAVSSIFTLMERDSYSRFVRQPEFKEALALSKVF